MLVGSDDRRVDEYPPNVAEVRCLGEEFEKGEQTTGIDPATETLIHRQPATELGGKIPPGDAGAGYVEQGLEEHPLGQFRFLTAPVAGHLTHAGPEHRPRLVCELVTHGILPRIR